MTSVLVHPAEADDIGRPSYLDLLCGDGAGAAGPAGSWRTIEAAATLADGTAVTIRALTPKYRTQYAAAVRRLTPDFLLRRFLWPMTITEKFFGTFVDQVDGVDHIAVIAYATDTKSPVGEARLIRYPNRPDTADIAFSVMPEWQRRGAAKILVAELMRHQLAGITTVVTMVDANNVPALRLMQSLGETEIGPVEGGAREVIVALRPGTLKIH